MGVFVPSVGGALWQVGDLVIVIPCNEPLRPTMIEDTALVGGFLWIYLGKKGGHKWAMYFISSLKMGGSGPGHL